MISLLPKFRSIQDGPVVLSETADHLKAHGVERLWFIRKNESLFAVMAVNPDIAIMDFVLASPEKFPVSRAPQLKQKNSDRRAS